MALDPTLHTYASAQERDPGTLTPEFSARIPPNAWLSEDAA
jgi:hypothetical protein